MKIQKFMVGRDTGWGQNFSTIFIICRTSFHFYLIYLKPYHSGFSRMVAIIIIIFRCIISQPAPKPLYRELKKII